MTNIEKLPNEDIYNDALARKGVRFLSQSRTLKKRLDELNQERPKEQGSRVGCASQMPVGSRLPLRGQCRLVMLPQLAVAGGNDQIEDKEKPCPPGG
jgi:hypothetical protein